MFDISVTVSVAVGVLFAVVIALLPVMVFQLRWITNELDTMKMMLNGKMEKLLHEYGRAERAAGVEDERQAERGRRVDGENENGGTNETDLNANVVITQEKIES